MMLPLFIPGFDASVLKELWIRLNSKFEHESIKQPLGLLSLITRGEQIQTTMDDFGLTKRDVLNFYGRMVSMSPLQKLLDEEFQFIEILSNIELYKTWQCKQPKLFESMHLFFEDFYKPKIEQVAGSIRVMTRSLWIDVTNVFRGGAALGKAIANWFNTNTPSMPDTEMHVDAVVNINNFLQILHDIKGSWKMIVRVFDHRRGDKALKFLSNRRVNRPGIFLMKWSIAIGQRDLTLNYKVCRRALKAADILDTDEHWYKPNSKIPTQECVAPSVFKIAVCYLVDKEN